MAEPGSGSSSAVGADRSLKLAVTALFVLMLGIERSPFVAK